MTSRLKIVVYFISYVTAAFEAVTTGFPQELQNFALSEQLAPQEVQNTIFYFTQQRIKVYPFKLFLLSN